MSCGMCNPLRRNWCVTPYHLSLSLLTTVQDSVTKIFKHAGNDTTRYHPAIRVVAEEFERAAEAGTPPDFNAFNVERIREMCVQEAEEHPGWNMKLTMRSLSMFLEDQDESTHWWLPGEPDFNDEEEDSEGE